MMQKSTIKRNELILEHLPLIKLCAKKEYGRNSNFTRYELEDFVNCAVEGLLRRFHLWKEAECPFERFIQSASVWSIRDEIRSRSTKTKTQHFTEPTDSIEQTMDCREIVEAHAEVALVLQRADRLTEKQKFELAVMLRGGVVSWTVLQWIVKKLKTKRRVVQCSKEIARNVRSVVI